MKGDNVCDPFGQVYIIKNGVLASKINVLSIGNEDWTNTYLALVYPDYYCIKVEPKTPEVKQALSFADQVVFNPTTGTHATISAGTLAIF